MNKGKANMLVLLALLLLFPLSVAAAERVTAVYTSITGAYAPLWVGRDKKLFDKYGIDASVVYMRGTIPTTAALANGEIDFIQAGASTYIPYAAKGGDVVILGCLANIVLDYVLLVHPSIRRVEELRGKPVGISRAGDQIFYYLREILKKYGMSIKDVRMVQTGQQPERMAALRHGLVVATILNTPNNLALEQEGFRRIVEMEEMKIPAGVRCLITTRRFVRQRPATAENFTKGWLHSVRFIQTQKKETMDLIGKYTNNSNAEQLQDTWQSLTYKTEIPPYVSVPNLQGQIQIIAEEQADIRKLDAAKIVDNSIMKKLDESGWIKTLFQ
jgi:ABC-type nitrate/sulfonate/bicarbonate transport system substrate-binding protein